jgi:2-polyprenyl-6-methoxyphenol hydroxylase-like FAD-dependent oxidoreductase
MQPPAAVKEGHVSLIKRERPCDYDAVVVGASVAGCTVATFLGRQGARVALLERSPNEDVYKVICTHAIMPCATGTLRRLGLVDPMERVLFTAAPRDQHVARALHMLLSRMATPQRIITPSVIARAAWVSARVALTRPKRVRL